MCVSTEADRKSREREAAATLLALARRMRHRCGTGGCVRPDKHPGLCYVPVMGKRKTGRGLAPWTHAAPTGEARVDARLGGRVAPCAPPRSTLKARAPNPGPISS